MSTVLLELLSTFTSKYIRVAFTNQKGLPFGFNMVEVSKLSVFNPKISIFCEYLFKSKISIEPLYCNFYLIFG